MTHTHTTAGSRSLGANGATVRARRAGDRVHARRRGAGAVRRGLRVPRRRCRRGDRHLLRQVHGPARRGRAEHRQRAVHHRPPSRIRGASGRLGVPRHHDGRSAHRTLRHPADLPAHAGRHGPARQRGGGRRQIPGGGPGLVHAAAAVVHRRRSHRRSRTAGLRGLGQVGGARRRAGHPRRVPQPRRRWTGAVPDLPPRAGQRCVPGRFR